MPPPEARGKRPTSLQDWFCQLLDRSFCVSLRGSTLSTEFRAGTTAFLATANNFIVNAHIMRHAGLDVGVSVVSGAFASAFGCIASGILSNLPLGIVPSVGPNVFLAYSLVAKHIYTTDQALAISTMCGVLLLVLSLTPVVKLALGLVPLSVKFGLVVGTGLLTALIGLKSIGIVVPDIGGQDIVALGRLDTLEVKIALVFLVLTASMLHLCVKGAVLVGILGATLVYWIVSGDWPTSVLAPRALTPHALDFWVLTSGMAWLQVGALLLMLLFSISGAVMGAARMAGLLRADGGVNGRTSVFVSCGAATIVSGLLGSSPVFVSMSSAAGIRDGGRTGLVSVVVGIYSLFMALLLSPLAAAIPRCAISPVLVLVGVSMTGEASEVRWRNIQESLPAFLCAVFQPFTYSVANGIFAGVGMSFVLFFTTGSFIAYMPCLRRLLMSESIEPESAKGGLVPVPLDPEGGLEEGRAEKRNMTVSPPGMESTADVSMWPRRRSESDVQGLVRGKLNRVGFGTTEQASWLVQQTASFVGFDGAAALQAFEERAQAARNVMDHCVCALPGREAEVLAKLGHLTLAGSTTTTTASANPPLSSTR